MWSSTTPLELLLVNNWKIFHRAFTSLQININNEHLSSIWPGNGYHLPWLLFQLVPEESWRLSLEVNDHHHIITKAILIITFLRCCFWSPIILLVCVARQVNLWRNRSETYFVPKVTQSFLPRVARPTPSVAKLSSTETNGTRVAKTDGRRSKTKWFAFVNSGLSNESQQQWTVSIGYVMESERSCPSPHFVAVFFSKMKIEALKPSICDNIVFLDLFYLKYSFVPQTKTNVFQHLHAIA